MFEIGKFYKCVVPYVKYCLRVMTSADTLRHGNSLLAESSSGEIIPLSKENPDEWLEISSADFEQSMKEYDAFLMKLGGN